MIELHLTRGDNQEGVRLRFPTTPAEIGELALNIFDRELIN